MTNWNESRIYQEWKAGLSLVELSRVTGHGIATIQRIIEEHLFEDQTDLINRSIWDD